MMVALTMALVLAGAEPPLRPHEQAYERALEARDAGRWEQALHFLEVAWKRHPDPVYLYNSGRAREALGRLSAARKTYARLLALKDLPRALAAMARSRQVALARRSAQGAKVVSVSGGDPASKPRPTIAVLYFDYHGEDRRLSVLRKGLAQMLITDLSHLDEIRLVERDRLEDILKEQGLAQKGVVDPATAVKIGKLLGAHHLIMGGYQDVFGTLRLDARLVSVERGTEKGTSAAGKPEDFLALERDLAKGVEALLRRQLRLAPSTDSPGPSPAVPLQAALGYSSGLDHGDAGRTAEARESLTAVVEAHPHFEVATDDLERIVCAH